MIDHDQTLPRGVDHAALAEQNLLHIGRVGYTDEDDIGVPRGFGGGFDQHGAARTKSLGLGARCACRRSSDIRRRADGRPWARPMMPRPMKATGGRCD